MIQVTNLWKKFGKHEALQGLSFAVPPGSAFALIGANGAGKAKSQSHRDERDELAAGREGDGRVLVAVNMNMDAYRRLKEQKVRVELTYSLTLIQLVDSYALPATNGNERLPDFGWCRTHVNERGDSIAVNCMQAGRPPDCYSEVLELTGERRNSTKWACSNRDYSPYLAWSYQDIVLRFGGQLQVHDPMAHTPFDVAAPDIGKAQVLIRNYRTVDHFTRTVTTPERPLSEWLQ
jgi:hypothetical protein